MFQLNNSIDGDIEGSGFGLSISKDYGLDDSFKFVNAILDKISKEQK